jgi:hypothetical protein
VREVIRNDQVVFVTREAEDRRSPDITMNKIKGLSSPGRGSGKRKTRMTVELASMTRCLEETHLQEILERPESWDIMSGPGWSRRRCQMVEVVVVARAWGGYASGGSGWQVNRVEGARAVIASEHDTSGKVSYGKPSGIELHRIVVVTGEATNQEKGMSQMGCNKDIVKVEWFRKN